jgi:hypothetical protein
MRSALRFGLIEATANDCADALAAQAKPASA